MTWPQRILAACAVLGAANALRQAVFATAAISPRLAILSAISAATAVGALLLLRRRHRAAVPALVLFAVALPLTTVLGTEWLLGDTLSLPARMPGYLVALGLGLTAAWGGVRELERAGSQGRSATPTGQLAAPMPDLDNRKARVTDTVRERE